MKVIASIVLLILLGTSNCFSGVITVDNTYPSAGNFTTLVDALNSTYNPGDTIYVYPSPQVYQAGTVLRETVILGVGWDNPGLDSYISTISGTMYFSPTSNGSILEGLLLQSVINIDADNVIIRKNKITACCTYIYPSHSNTRFEQNYFETAGNYNNHISGILDIADYNTVTVANNFFHNTSTGWARGCWGSSWAKYAIITAYGTNCDINVLNNIFLLQVAGAYGCDSRTGDVNWDLSIKIYCNNQQVRNNIIINGAIRCNDNTTSYNVCFNTLIQWGVDNDYAGYTTGIPGGEGNFNRIITDLSSLFETGGYHLKQGSPAIGAGKDGTDCGIYGGKTASGEGTPFVDGGYPGIPIVYGMDCNHIGTRQNGLRVKIKAKSNK